METSRTTVWRRLRDAGYQILKYTDISDEQLDNVLTTIQEQYPNWGQQLISGFFKSRGIYIPIYRLRESILRVDPLR